MSPPASSIEESLGWVEGRPAVLERARGAAADALGERTRLLSEMCTPSLPEVLRVRWRDDAIEVAVAFVGTRTLADLAPANNAVRRAAVGRVAQALGALHTCGVAHNAVTESAVRLGPSGAVLWDNDHLTFHDEEAVRRDIAAGIELLDPSDRPHPHVATAQVRTARQLSDHIAALLRRSTEDADPVLTTGPTWHPGLVPGVRVILAGLGAAALVAGAASLWSTAEASSPPSSARGTPGEAIATVDAPITPLLTPNEQVLELAP